MKRAVRAHHVAGPDAVSRPVDRPEHVIALDPPNKVQDVEVGDGSPLRPPVRVALARAEQTVPGPEARRWCYEPKFDGWRAVLFCARKTLQSRSGADLSRRFPDILRDSADLADLVLDGELVALNAAGRLDFAALQRSPATRAQASINVYYMVFDVLAAGDSTCAANRTGTAGPAWSSC